MTAIPGTLPIVARPGVTFASALRSAFVKATDFRGRATRAEYWWFALANVIAQSILTQADLMAFGMPALSMVWMLVALVPSLSLAVRRMHDIGKSGWALLYAFIPVAGIIMVIVWLCRDSEEGTNRFA